MDRSVRERSEKHFERSNGLDAALYVSHLNEMSRMSENLQRQKVAG